MSNFTLKEKMLRIKYITMVVMILILQIAYTLVDSPKVYFFCLVPFDVIMCGILISSFRKVMKSMKFFIPDQEKEQKLSLTLYLVFDLIIYGSFLIKDIIYISNQTLGQELFNNFVFKKYIQLCPVLQALGLCFIKKTQDPFSNVSKLS